MNTLAHRLSVLFATACLVMGLATPLGIGPPFLPPSWLALYQWIPFANVIYPGTFVVTGVVAFAGIWYVPALRLSCWMVFALHLIWGSVGLILTVWGLPGGNVPGSFANLMTAGLALVVASSVPIGVRVDALNHEIIQRGTKVLHDSIK